MATFTRFEDIQCWQLGRKIDNELHPLTLVNGFERDFKLKDQILSSSGSIMDNISEGFGRRGNKDFVRFLSYSKGSSEELKSQLYRAMDRGYINQEQFQSLYDQAHVVGRKLGALMNMLENSSYKSDYTPSTDHEEDKKKKHATNSYEQEHSEINNSKGKNEKPALS
jgi:four helix bundle protein